MPTATPLNVVWQKNGQNNEWFDFLRLNLDAPYFNGKKGVFVIWYAAPGRAKTIRVGGGNLAEQLKDLRSNQLITQYANNGPLKVSWVAVNGVLKENEMSGVEAFLYDLYTPLTGSKPAADPIPVNAIK